MTIVGWVAFGFIVGMVATIFVLAMASAAD
jgi:hypothetical protein